MRSSLFEDVLFHNRGAKIGRLVMHLPHLQESKVLHQTADVSADVSIPESCSVWHYAQVREQVVMGENCIIGRGAYIGSGVKMGKNCKIQNYALVYEPAELADGVFIGPAVVLTNDEYPRAVTPDGELKSGHDWVAVGVTVKQGASIGARSVCVAPVTIGAWTLIAAGSVVTKNVPDFALVAGVPAKRIGWVGKAGIPLLSLEDNKFECPQTGSVYIQIDADTLVEEKV